MNIKKHFEIFAQDLRYAARGFRRAPMFTLVAVFAIALGVGASTAVFSVVDRILFRSLPYANSDRLVSFGMVAPIAPQEFLLGYDYLDWRDADSPFESMGSWLGVGDCDLNDSNPVRLRCATVDPTLLPTLGIQPILGRNINRDEDRPNAPKVAIISHAIWQSRFAGDPGIVGKTMPLDGKSTTILGVLPPQFEMPSLEPVDMLVPQGLNEAEQRSRRLAVLVWTVGRLKPGYTHAQALAGLQPLFNRSLESVSPQFRKEIKLRMRSLRDRQILDAHTASWILFAAVALVLLIACANVANLLLARAATRQRELAVRAALGAARGRLLRQTLTESSLLAVIGGAAGCALAFLLLRLFVAIAPAGIPRLNQAGIDWRVLLFTLAVSLVSGMFFGLAPALQTPKAEALTGWRTLGHRHHLFRQALAAAQICVSLILLTGASLLLRSLWNLQNQPLGMQARTVMTAAVSLGQTGYSDPVRRLAFFESMETRLSRLPGVANVALTDTLPPTADIMGSMLYAAIEVQNRPRYAAGTGGTVAWRSITPRYFAVLGIPILRGRAFEERDRDPNQNAVILSDSLARRMFPGEDPLGKQIRPGLRGDWLTVVGVAGNVKNNGLIERDDPEYYVVRKHSTAEIGSRATALLGGTLNHEVLAKWVRAEIAAIDPTLPVTIGTMDERVRGLAERPRFNAVLLGIFASMGLLLAAIGLYGVISFLVAQRTQEIGVRMALGATPAAIARMVLRHAASWTIAGAVLGLIGSFFAVRMLQAMLFHVSAKDPWTMAAAVSMLLGVAMLAAWVPSRRAARVDPIQALREE